MQKLIFFLLVVTISSNVQAQHPPFWDEIAAFQKADSLNPPPEHPIVFTGSSSFQKWTGVREAFPGYPIINRGFGGSKLPDVIRYTEQVIIKYAPRQVVIYCGDNDLASSDTVTPAVVLRRFKELFFLIRGKLDRTDILYVSIKPSPSREQLMPRMEETNRMIRKFLRKQKHARFVDVYHKMLTPEGKPMDDLFLADKLHMNAKGYAIWQRIIQRKLDRS